MSVGEANVGLKMTSFDFAIVIGAICGVIMVLGAIYLLKLGIINLKDISQQAHSEQANAKSKPSEKAKSPDALTIAYNDIKISTQYPALALFVIGLAFVLGSAYLATPNPRFADFITKINVAAEKGIKLPSGATVQIYIKPDELPIMVSEETTHTYQHPINPLNLYGRIIVSGLEPIEKPLQSHGGVWQLKYTIKTPPKNLSQESPPEGRTIVPIDN